VTSELDRLRRELRAVTAMNQQLQAQRDEPVAVRRERRGGAGGEWLDQLAALGASEPTLIRTDTGALFVAEGSTKRAVRSGLVAAALEDLLGEPAPVTAAEADGYREGVAVELFEASVGPPFVVLGGKRHNVHGMQLPYPVDNRYASEFPEGDEINVADANVARRRLEKAVSRQSPIPSSLASRGTVGTAKHAVRRVGSKVKRMFSS
jgi:hypothetical protein